MADDNLTRTYTIPLRKRFIDVPRYKRAKRAVKTVRAFLERHMKSETVKLGAKLNEKLWEHGIKNPPARVTVSATKDKNGVVKAELEGYKYVEFKVKEKTPEKSGGMQEKLKQKVQDAKGGAKGDSSETETSQTAESASSKTIQKKQDSDSKGAAKKTVSKKTTSTKKTTTKQSSTEKSASESSSSSAGSKKTTKKTASKKTASASESKNE
ncbi:MAG: 50S ribosomal protein L31e [Candidatus Woesearchaeota archaeon]